MEFKFGKQIILSLIFIHNLVVFWKDGWMKWTKVMTSMAHGNTICVGLSLYSSIKPNLLQGQTKFFTQHGWF